MAGQKFSSYAIHLTDGFPNTCFFRLSSGRSRARDFPLPRRYMASVRDNQSLCACLNIATFRANVELVVGVAQRSATTHKDPCSLSQRIGAAELEKSIQQHTLIICQPKVKNKVHFVQTHILKQMSGALQRPHRNAALTEPYISVHNSEKTVRTLDMLFSASQEVAGNVWSWRPKHHLLVGKRCTGQIHPSRVSQHLGWYILHTYGTSGSSRMGAVRGGQVPLKR